MLSSSNPSSLGNGTKLYMLDLPKKWFFGGVPNAQQGDHFTEAQQVAATMERAVHTTLAEHPGLCATVPSQAQ